MTIITAPRAIETQPGTVCQTHELSDDKIDGASLRRRHQEAKKTTDQQFECINADDSKNGGTPSYRKARNGSDSHFTGRNKIEPSRYFPDGSALYRCLKLTTWVVQGSRRLMSHNFDATYM